MAAKRSAHLTDQIISELQPEADRYLLRDLGTHGLWLQVLPSGTKSWLVVWYTGEGESRRQKTTTLGRYPTVSLDYARDLAAEIRGEADRIANEVRVIAASPAQLRLRRASDALRQNLIHAAGDVGGWIAPEEGQIADLLLQKSAIVAVVIAIYEADMLRAYDESVPPGDLLECVASRADELIHLVQLAKGYSQRNDASQE